MARFKFTHYLIQETLYPAGFKKIETFKAWHYTKPIVKAGSNPKDHWVISLNSSRLGNTIQTEDLGKWRQNADGNMIRMTIGEPIALAKEEADIDECGQCQYNKECGNATGVCDQI